MATDHAVSVDSEAADADSAAYVTPAVDFLLLFGLTALFVLGTTVVITP